MRLPEDPGLFAVVRKAKEHERYTFQPTKQEIEAEKKIPAYNRIIHLISPYINHLDGTEEPSCNCIHWMTKKTRCVHLKKFFELNPHLDPGEKPKKKIPLPEIPEKKKEQD